MRTILEVTWNFSPATMEGNATGRMETYGETVESARVGDGNTKEIKEYPAEFDGDKYYYDIHSVGDNIVRVFNPNTVTYKND